MLNKQIDNRAEIGRRLRQFGLSRFASLSEFASRLGVAQPVLSNYLSGRYRPGNKMQTKLRALGCDIEWLMTGKASSTAEVLKTFVREHPGSYIPDNLPESTRKKIKRLIDEVKDMDDSDLDRVREIIRTIFVTQNRGKKGRK